MKTVRFFVLVFVVVAVGMWIRGSVLSANGLKETALARILRTQTIRCGYVISEPYLLRDPNTQAFSGIAFDYMTALAKELGVKLVWAEETGWGNFQEGLTANKYDVFCVPTYQSGERARIAAQNKKRGFAVNKTPAPARCWLGREGPRPRSGAK